ncbi:MAG: type II toxin-antitoxin system VapC family toxin [Candidatus Jacksonbacteria bacterium]|nr:type II toxin-antitoxin system VapC family toxin [Candidatus Jacksonbacteria bacterium]
MTILDSNIWIAFFYDPDTLHAKARKLVKAISAPIILPEYVCGEVCTVLSQRGGKQLADRFVDTVENNEDVIILPFEHEDFWNTLALFRKQSQKTLSFVDISLLYLSDLYSVETFDTQLGKAIGRNKS